MGKSLLLPRGRVVVLVLMLLLGFTLLVSSPFLSRRWVQWRYADAITQLSSAVDNRQHARVAIVFGARVYGSGRLSAMLRDRVDTAIALYEAGVVDKLLLSGDNSVAEYDEPGAMMAHAIAAGVPVDDIQPDYGGRRTYDSCYRAGAVFQVEKAILVTQEFHRPRALLLCNTLGVEASGVIADRRVYDPRSIAWSETRELPALMVAFWDLLRRAPPPVLGEPIVW